MTKFRTINFIFFVLAINLGLAQTLSKETIVLNTHLGTLKIKLYEETPLYKTNFLKLVKAHYFDSLLFHRVIQNFMIQGGDPLSKNAKPGDTLGHGELQYTIPAEISTNLIHKKGVLCAAREGDAINPNFESSPCQFYIVQGKVRTPEELKKAEDRINTARYHNAARKVMNSKEGKTLKLKYDAFKQKKLTDSAEITNAFIEELIKIEMGKTLPYAFSPYQTKTYTSIGGTPHLDGTYTVFGEVIEGLVLIDKIAAVKTDKRDRPIEDVRMQVYLE